MKPNRNSLLRALWARVLELIGAVDKKEKEKLEIELVNSNWENTYDLAQQALDRLDTQIIRNKRLRQEAKQLHAVARAINEMFG